MPKERDQVESSVDLLVDIDKLDGIGGLLCRPFYGSAEVKVFCQLLVFLEIVAKAFRLSRSDAAAQVKEIFTPQRVVGERLRPCGRRIPSRSGTPLPDR